MWSHWTSHGIGKIPPDFSNRLFAPHGDKYNNNNNNNGKCNLHNGGTTRTPVRKNTTPVLNKLPPAQNPTTSNITTISAQNARTHLVVATSNRKRWANKTVHGRARRNAPARADAHSNHATATKEKQSNYKNGCITNVASTNEMNATVRRNRCLKHKCNGNTTPGVMTNWPAERNQTRDWQIGRGQQ